MRMTLRIGVLSMFVMMLGLLAVTPRAVAGGKDPATILSECDAAIEAVADAATDEMVALAIEADAELEALFFDGASPSRLMRAAAGYVAKAEKIETKAQSKIAKLAAKCEARLTRANASSGFFDDLDALVDADQSAIGLTFFNSVTSILDSMNDWIFPV